MPKMNILVLGGSGFISSHVCDQLSQAGHKIRIFDLVTFQWLSKDQEFEATEDVVRFLTGKSLQGLVPPEEYEVQRQGL